MNINRRQFAGHLAKTAAALALATPVLMLEGCSVWTEIEQWVPVGIAAFESVVVLVAPLSAPGIDTMAELVKAGFAALAAAVDQYINAPASDKVGLLAKVRLIFEDISTNLQSFLSAVNVPGTNPIVKIVLGLVNIILSTIAGFVQRIGGAITKRALTLAGQTVTVSPVLRNRKQFRNEINAALVAGGYPQLQIH